MLQRDVKIINKLGLHARASAKLSQLASRYQAQVWLEHQGKRVNAKSIMGVMMLAASNGCLIRIETDGADESAAMDELVALIDDRFGEGE